MSGKCNGNKLNYFFKNLASTLPWRSKTKSLTLCSLPLHRAHHKTFSRQDLSSSSAEAMSAQGQTTGCSSLDCSTAPRVNSFTNGTLQMCPHKKKIMSVKLKVSLTHSRHYSFFSTQELWCSVNKASMEPQDKTGNRIWAPQDFFFFFEVVAQSLSTRITM